MLRACKEFCVFDSFKYFHTADTFAALVHATIWSCHIIVRYNLFGHLTYSATILVAEHSVHSYYFCYLNVWNRNNDVWLKDCCSFWTSSSMNADLNVFNTCFTSASVEHDQRVFYRHPFQWMSAFTSEAWWWLTIWFINIGSYKTCFSRSTDTLDVKQSQ